MGAGRGAGGASAGAPAAAVGASPAAARAGAGASPPVGNGSSAAGPSPSGGGGGGGGGSARDGSRGSHGSSHSQGSTSQSKWQDQLSRMTNMIFVASQGDVDELTRLLDEGADVNSADYDGRSAIHLAACEGHLGVLQLLLARGARVNPRDRWGHTPLTDARKAMREGKKGQFQEIIQVLIKHGGIEGGAEADDWEIDPCELDFSKSKLIGKGAFGEIRRVMWRGTPVAAKTILPGLSDDVQITKEFRDEMFLLPKLRHPNIVQFLGCVTRRPPLCLVTEYLPGGDLHDVLKSKGALPPRIAVGYGLDIARGMNYLHNHKPESIIHRDLKPRNLIRDEGDHLKVADFGLSKLVKVNALHEMYKMTGETGSYRYMAPEVFKHQAYDRSVDVYSFSVIFYEMFEGLPPFAKTMTPEGVAWKVAMEGIRPPFKSKSYPEGVKDLISRCWASDPMSRPSFMEVIEVLEGVEKALLLQAQTNKPALSPFSA
ncbi:hypothetical protein CLOM_g24277 [Closterium sp. NIES-68]|nr:hypothetical protein CLOM_g24277 [Closterium sp. NIES-68]GJP83054.1 hypothetical protein CLOP_g13261 [Closterium sp. NIES-67]